MKKILDSFRALAAVILLAGVLTLGTRWVLAYQPQPEMAQPIVQADSCPPVQNTPLFTIAYGHVTINDQPAVTGTTVEARTPRGETAGCFAVSSQGHYGVMYIYGEDTTVTPPIPGLRSGEAARFYVNGITATAVPTLTWGNDHDLHEVAIQATVTQVQARFVASPTSGVAPLTVAFTNTSTGDYTTSLWDLGDKVTSTLASPTHTYTAAGVYSVTLAVSGPGGSHTLVKSAFITVLPPWYRVYLPVVAQNFTQR